MAVVVAHNGAGYLSATLAALGAQRRPADFSVGIDAGSTDGSASILQLKLPAGSPVVGSASRAGFGAAVRTGLAEVPDRQQTADPVEDGPVRDWIWLLHDDSAPDPEALQELLLAVERAPSVTVAGSKQVEWDNRRKIVDVGLSISRWAERLTLIDVDELDQGQHDFISDVFAVNSAGMLVRRDVWDDLGGFDPALPGTGDDVDFCWRNRLAGHRVVVVPGAVMRHAGSRDNPAASLRAARKSEVYLRLKHAMLWKVPFLAVGAVIGGFGRLIMGLLAKDPGYGFSQLMASIAAVLRPLDLFRSRRRAAGTRKRPRSVVRALRTSRREVWSHRRSVLEAFSAQGHLSDAAVVREQSTYVPSGDAPDDFSALATPARTWIGVGAVAAALVLSAVSFAGLYRLFGAPALAGGSLLPVSASMVDIWHNASSWWINLGAGYAGHGDPFGYVLWLLAALGFGNGNAALVALFLLALPLAGLSAWFAAGALTRRRGLRFWAAFFWAAVPALQVALGSGRLGALLAHLLIPLAALALMRAVGAAPGPHPAARAQKHPDHGQANKDTDDAAYRLERPAEVMLKPGINGVPSWTAAAAAGLLLAGITAGSPSLFPLAVIAVLGASLVLRRRAKTLWWALLPALALMVPFAGSTLNSLRAVLGDPGVPLPFDAAQLWQQLLGYPVGFDPAATLAALPFLPQGPWAFVAALVVGAPVILLAAAALFLPGRGRATARGMWVLGLAALALSAALSSVAVAVGSSSLIAPFTGPLVSAFAFTMLAAALRGGDSILGLHRTRQAAAAAAGRTPRRSASAVLVAAAVVLGVGPAASLALWVVPQAAGTQLAADTTGTGFGTQMRVAPSAQRTLPATAADRGNSGERTRTLVLNIDGSNNASATLMRSGGTTLDQLSQIYSARTIFGPLGSAQLRDDDDATAAVRSTVAVIVAGTGVDPREQLAALGVGFVVLQQSDSAAEVLASQIDSVPGLVSVGNTRSGWLWRVGAPALPDDAAAPDGAGDDSAPGARTRILNAEGATEVLVDSGPTSVRTTIPDGGEGRLLVLAERSDTGWQATLDSEPLEPASTGWAQAFALPADGGTLEVNFVGAWEPWAAIGSSVIIGLTALLAIPMPARPRFVKVSPGRRGRTQDPDGPSHGPAAGDGGPPDSAASPTGSTGSAGATGSAGLAGNPGATDSAGSTGSEAALSGGGRRG